MLTEKQKTKMVDLYHYINEEKDPQRRKIRMMEQNIPSAEGFHYTVNGVPRKALLNESTFDLSLKEFKLAIFNTTLIEDTSPPTWENPPDKGSTT